ncbi:ABC transporter permease [candidate division WWE3 bacterium CG_4_9_14_3_um_filter_41_6]|uniref:ABC transporter permease n=1 Tax=candidate division WWE3 bacterium CG_4_10_14_0_2_um_filter_41_14 TaxID=1975072 RepID=A0A2M7TJ01_UNCKA|nr:MAG: ABC transporter permease [candidate division WWE3 bacterium CG_4_10_14_0_2_um_filter_41_14]PJA39420.1 MAG: ABC transporter permease [candidate division WWE3 bacterium CG_4_9_14_3_um_filter_41_6]
MIIHYVTEALLSFWNNKVRTTLNLLGVIIGVTAVTTLVSLGDGLKQEVSNMIEGFGTNVLTIVNGNIDTTTGSTQNANPANFVATDILSLDDVATIEQTPDVSQVSPVSLVPGKVTYRETTATPIIMGVTGNMFDAFEILSLKEGDMFAKNDNRAVAVIGPKLVETLFGSTNPIGESITIKDQSFTIIGLSHEPKLSDLTGSEFSNLVLIPFSQATKLNSEKVAISRIIVKATDSANVNTVRDSIKSSLMANHDGEEDFSILTQKDLLGLFDDFVNLATTLVSAIAAISLVVGGIGIMNIMLVTVTERTKEIGIRKAVGATKTAILLQFLTEATLITLMGGLIGLALSFVIGMAVSYYSPLSPVISVHVIALALGVSTSVGIIFGIWPAMRAAQKDPIEALRYE